jgi:hypothetical protein
MAESEKASVRLEDMREIAAFARLNHRRKEATAELAEVEVGPLEPPGLFFVYVSHSHTHARRSASVVGKMQRSL